MDFSLFVGKVCKIDVSSGYFHKGKVLDADENFISLIDEKGNSITLSITTVLNVREVSNG